MGTRASHIQSGSGVQRPPTVTYGPALPLLLPAAFAMRFKTMKLYLGRGDMSAILSIIGGRSSQT